MSITRYRCEPNSLSDDPQGDLVDYHDHAAEVERLRHDLRVARARPYLRAAVAWSSEDGDLVVLGTHDPAHANAAIVRYLTEIGDVGEAEWDEWMRNPETVLGAQRRFVDPLVIEDEAWPREYLSPEPQPGWLSFLFARYT